MMTLTRFRFRLRLLLPFLLSVLTQPLLAESTADDSERLQELLYREILYLYRQEDYAGALTRWQVAAEKGLLPELPAESELLLARLKLAYGMDVEAGLALTRLMTADQPLRVLLLADTHLGFDEPRRPRVEKRRRGPDFWANYHRALAPAREGRVDLVVHGGDLLYRSKVPPGLVAAALEPLLENLASPHAALRRESVLALHRFRDKDPRVPEAIEALARDPDAAPALSEAAQLAAGVTRLCARARYSGPASS